MSWEEVAVVVLEEGRRCDLGPVAPQKVVQFKKCKIPHDIEHMHSPAMAFGGDCTILTPSRAGVAAEDATDGTPCEPVHPSTACPLLTPSKDGVAEAASSGEKIPDMPGKGGRKAGGWEGGG